MKKLSIIILAMLCFAGCKKDKEEGMPYAEQLRINATIVGHWKEDGVMSDIYARHEIFTDDMKWTAFGRRDDSGAQTGNSYDNTPYSID